MAELSEAVLPLPAPIEDASSSEGPVTMLHEAPPRSDSGLFESSPPSRVHRIEGYGHTRWGMCPEDVMDVCPGARRTSVERLDERKRVAKLPAEVAYLFADDRLYLASVTFKASLDNGMEFIAKFKNLRRLLFKKYGEPLESQTLLHRLARL